MARVNFREAVAGDHETLEKLFSETSMAGAIRIGSDRSPDFFAASCVQATEPCVWGAFTENGQAVGVFSAGKRDVWLGGEIAPMRYLSDLRIHPQWREGTLLARGFREVRNQIFKKGEWAQTLVLESNPHALQFLRSGRAGLPEYRPAGRYVNWLLPQQKLAKAAQQVRFAHPSDLPAMQSILDESSKRRSFSPVVDLRKLGDPFLKDLSLGNFLLAEEAGKIRGMMAFWDQHRFQRLRLDGYSKGMATIRPVWNFAARLRGEALLPLPGSAIPVIKASMVACAEDNPEILRSLLSTALSAGTGSLLSVALSESDPLADALRSLKGRIFRGLHFLVGWEGRPPHWEEPFGFDPARI